MKLQGQVARGAAPRPDEKVAPIRLRQNARTVTGSMRDTLMQPTAARAAAVGQLVTLGIIIPGVSMM
jgi:hypothetical protein